MKKGICIAILITMTSSCSLITKPISVPLRVVGAVFSIIPGAGDAVHKAMDEAASAVDSIL